MSRHYEKLITDYKSQIANLETHAKEVKESLEFQLSQALLEAKIEKQCADESYAALVKECAEKERSWEAERQSLAGTVRNLRDELAQASHAAELERSNSASLKAHMDARFEQMYDESNKNSLRRDQTLKNEHHNLHTRIAELQRSLSIEKRANDTARKSTIKWKIFSMFHAAERVRLCEQLQRTHQDTQEANTAKTCAQERLQQLTADLHRLSRNLDTAKKNEQKTSDTRRVPVVCAEVQTDTVMSAHPPHWLVVKTLRTAVAAGDVATLQSVIPALPNPWKLPGAEASSETKYRLDAKEGRKLLCLAVEKRQASALDSLLRMTTALADDALLMRAVDLDFTAGAKRLVEEKCDVNVTHRESQLSACAVATTNFNTKLVRYLMDHNADPERGQYPCLVLAVIAEWKQDVIQRIFVEENADRINVETLSIAVKEAKRCRSIDGRMVAGYLQDVLNDRIDRPNRRRETT